MSEKSRRLSPDEKLLVVKEYPSGRVSTHSIARHRGYLPHPTTFS